MMKREQSRFAIGRGRWQVPMASKYGALDRLRSAVGILHTKRGRLALAISVDEMTETDWSVDNKGYLLISRLSDVLTNELIP